MSIQKMLALHADVSGDVNETLATAARHAMFCAEMCTSCADARSAEEMDMRQCIRSCLDCAATARLAIRRTGENVAVLRAMLETCIRTCELCAEECARHEHAHCQLCAEMCRECAEDCRKALPTVM